LFGPDRRSRLGQRGDEVRALALGKQRLAAGVAIETLAQVANDRSEGPAVAPARADHQLDRGPGLDDVEDFAEVGASDLGSACRRELGFRDGHA
jgi:hypothetical protein